MKFTREAWKTVTLSFLVLLSIVLTWNIWFFQIDFKVNNSPANSLDEVVSIAESKDLDQVVKPYLSVMHKNGSLLGQTNNESVSKIYSIFEQGRVFKYYSCCK